jgi:pyruvate dehydrogenase E1 component alpha subunit
MSAAAPPDRDTRLELYRRMALIRLCDDRMQATIRSGRLIAPYYSPRGQEAVAAGTAVALRPDDYYITIYRGIHDHLAKGVPLRALWAEYAGRATGSC